MDDLAESAKELKGSVTTFKRGVVILLGLLILLFGVIGILIPLVPGFLILLPGLLLLSIYSPTIYKKLQHRAQKYPRIQSWTDRARNWLITHIHPHNK